MTNDQRFLLTVIIGTHSGWKRVAEELEQQRQGHHDRSTGLPEYTIVCVHHLYHNHLGPGELIWNILWQSLAYSLHRRLRMLGPGSNNLRFINFIPTNLRTCLHVEEQFMAIDNIVFIDNPSTSYLRKEVVARFKTLTGPQGFVLEKDAAKLPNYVTDEVFYEVIAREGRLEGQPHFSVPCRGSYGRKCNISVAFSPLNTTGAAATCSAGVGVVWTAEVDLAGSITGLVTLAESEDCYLFNVSPPGVIIDQMETAAFSCEFNMDDEVLIEGEIATGGNTVESRTGNPCPPGHFSLRFHLPSCVYPRRANCNFRSDVIFEGIVKKQIEN